MGFPREERHAIVATSLPRRVIHRTCSANHAAWRGFTIIELLVCLAGTWTGMHPMEAEGPERVVGFVDHTPNDPAADEEELSSRHPGGVLFLFGDGTAPFRVLGQLAG